MTDLEHVLISAMAVHLLSDGDFHAIEERDPLGGSLRAVTFLEATPLGVALVVRGA